MLEKKKEKYINSPFNFTGNKFKLLEQIIPEMDYSKEYFVDLFTGGGSVYTNIVHKYDKILVNDIITELIGIHKGLLEGDDIIIKTKSLCPSKDDKDAFLKLRNSFNEEKTPEKLWALMLSCTSNMMRFNKKFQFNQTFGKRSWNDSTTKKVEKFTEHIRQYQGKILFTSKTFNDINIKKPSMVYIDPPYSNTEAGYNNYWEKNDDLKLYNYCKELDKNGSSFMVSGVLSHDGESCLLLDKLIADGYIVKELDYDYEKVARKKNSKKSQEVIIMNY